MRPLKFRAWAKTGYMFNVTYLSWNKKKGLEYIRGERCDGKGMIGGHENYINMNDIILMQFTGLSDKNGVEIFEGDVVRIHYTDSIGTEIGDIMWFPPDAKFIVNTSTAQLGFGWLFQKLKKHPWTVYAHIEVIGNIHENPELLK